MKLRDDTDSELSMKNKFLMMTSTGSSLKQTKHQLCGEHMHWRLSWLSHNGSVHELHHHLSLSPFVNHHPTPFLILGTNLFHLLLSILLTLAT